MKKLVVEFLRRGFVGMGFGPMVLAILYLVLQWQGVVQTLTVNQVCLGIFSLSVLAFVAGGMNVIYQVERLPLMVAILIHGCVLYACYLATYLVNGWLEGGHIPIMVFSGIVVLGYLAIWAVVFSVVKRNTSRVNESLKKKQHSP